jgi:hypothetical protein
VNNNAVSAAPAVQHVLSFCPGASSSAVDIPGERSMEDDAVLLADDEEMGALTASTLQGSPPADGVWQGDAAAAASPPIEDMVMVEQMDVISAAPAEDTAAEEAPADAAAAAAADDGEASAAATTSQEEVAAAPAAAGSDAAAAAVSEGSVDADAGADNGMSANPFAPSAAVEEPQQQGSDASVVPAEQEGSADAAPAAATSNSGSATSAVAPPAAEGSGSSEACGGIKAHWQGKSHPVQVPDEF